MTALGTSPHGKMANFASLREKVSDDCLVSQVEVRDVRFPTSLESHGSDAMHTDPDYSAAYVIISVSNMETKGHGHSFTLGKGTDVVVSGVRALSHLVVGKRLREIYTNFGSFWASLVNESQLRWIGPEKGAIHLAVAGVINALWDLWGKIEGKPVWKLLSDMTPEEIVSLLDFRYISDALTQEEALGILREGVATRAAREEELHKNGYPSYITSVGWLGYDDEKVKTLCKEALKDGFTRFKMKVGQDVQDDIRRAAIIREEIGWEYPLMMDSNQRWELSEAVEWMTQLAKFKPLWIEEPTSPDDILAHAKIAQELKKYNIAVATGEHCHNKVMFKQFMQAGGMDYCQIDSCRLGGVNEVISVLLLAAKFRIPVCPHAGGVGLCEYVQHLAMFDYVCVSRTKEDRMIEYAAHLHEHFVDPIAISGGSYMPPSKAGYSGEMKPESLVEYEYPNGPVWVSLQNTK